MMDEQCQQKRECQKANRQKRQQKVCQQQAGNDMGIITGAHHEDQVPADEVSEVHVTSNEPTTHLHEADHNMASAANTQQQPVNVMDDTATDPHTADTMQPQRANHHIASGANRQRQQVNDSTELCLGAGCRCNLDSMNLHNYLTHNLGNMDGVCTFCGATGFHQENRASRCTVHYGVICCNSGKVQPPSLPDLPPSFQRLYTSTEPPLLFFCSHIRKFNASFCMASTNVQDVSLHPPASFQIRGQLF